MRDAGQTEKGAVLAQWLSGCWWPLVLILYTVPFRVVRARQSTTLGLDEIFSLLMAHKPVGEMVELTAFDAHPPTYYLILKCWLALGTILHADSLLWARALNIAAGAYVIALAWLIGRRLIGVIGASLFAFLLAINPNIAFAQVDLRNYMLAMASVFTCFLILLHCYDQELHGKGSGWKLWAIYALAASLALWLHLLCSLVLMLLGITWLAMCGKVGTRSGFFRMGLLAHICAAASFLPWLFHLPGQLEYLSDAQTNWMTQPTGVNLFGVFSFWYAIGRAGLPSHSWLETPTLAASFLTLLPFALALARRLSQTMLRRADNLGVFILVGIAIPVVYTLTLFLLALTHTAKVFEGPRYPVIAMPLYLFAISAACVMAVEKWKFRGAWPWILCGAWMWLAQSGTNVQKITDTKVQEFMAEVPANSGMKAGELLYTAPQEIIPYIQNYLPTQRLLPISALTQLDEHAGEIRLLLCPHWRNVQPTSFLLLSKMIDTGGLSASHEILKLETSFQFRILELHTLQGALNRPVLQRIAAGEVIRSHDNLRNAISTAFPENQRITDGYQQIEVTSEFLPVRWTRKESVRVRFNRPVDAGDYILKLELFRQPYPAERTLLTFKAEGESEIYRAEADAGSSTVQVPVHFEKRHDDLVFDVTHPVWRPVDVIQDAKDVRKLGFYFYHAYLEKQRKG